VFGLAEAGSDAVPRPCSGAEAVELMAATVAFWTGAIVAAPTTSLPEREVGHLAGYLGSAPVRIGNGAAQQLQLDIYGELMDSVYLYDRWHRPISSAHWDTITTRADWLCDHWDQPDEGIWETRGGPRKFLTGEQQGNFPPALTHLALISATLNLDRALDGPAAAAADGRR
jgi:GH15 family glucan-1,4-alpha-glucosidase